MSNTTRISIERIDVGSLIYVRDGFNAAAEVLDIDFDCIDTYSITFGTNDWSDVTSVKAGGTVEAYNHQTFLRAEKDISVEELQAKIAALDAAISDDQVASLRNLGAIADLNGYVCQPISEARRAEFFDAVARALDVPAVAAE